MVGDRCLITAVRPGSDAQEKLAPGDEVIAWQGFAPKRATFWKLNYSINRLFAAPVQQFAIRRPDGSEHKVEVTVKVKQLKRVLDLTSETDLYQLIREEENDERLHRQEFQETGEGPMIWKMPEFDLSDDGVDHMIRQARQHPAMVLDLRGNPGGLVKMLQYLVGSIMDHDVTIATRKGRKPDLKPMVAKSRHGAAFTGKLIVLVDSRSASAAELFARVVQLEQRGTVLGDHSSGSVMESRYYPFSQGLNTQFYYGASITDADLIMGDGMSLEHNGVVPDEVILPTPADLAAGRDPVLARAVQLAGGKMSAVQAGRLFPVEWQPE
jgi:C-terminal processing protease CtpA/Prc